MWNAVSRTDHGGTRGGPDEHSAEPWRRRHAAGPERPAEPVRHPAPAARRATPAHRRRRHPRPTARRRRPTPIPPAPGGDPSAPAGPTRRPRRRTASSRARRRRCRRPRRRAVRPAGRARSAGVRPPSYPAPMPGPAEPSKGMAITALILSFLGCTCVGAWSPSSWRSSCWCGAGTAATTARVSRSRALIIGVLTPGRRRPSAALTRLRLRQGLQGRRQPQGRRLHHRQGPHRPSPRRVSPRSGRWAAPTSTTPRCCPRRR